MTRELVLIALVALFWGAYPLVARASGHGGPWGALVLNLAALLPIGLAVALLPGASMRPSPEATLKLGVAGAMMGCGLVAFNLLANSRLEASVSIPIVDTAMLLVTTACAVVFFQEAVTAQKLLGIALLVAGILALRPSG
jgi:drug/metabolite transporter (DMT)-like permease